MDNDDVLERYAYSRCITCGCLSRKPVRNTKAITTSVRKRSLKVRLFNMHPIRGAMNRESVLEAIVGRRRHNQRGNAQNCVKVCPMNIPLTKAIYEENARQCFMATGMVEEMIFGEACHRQLRDLVRAERYQVSVHANEECHEEILVSSATVLSKRRSCAFLSLSKGAHYVDHVPVGVCRKCGELYFDAAVLQTSEKNRRGTKRDRTKITFPWQTIGKH